MRYRVPTGRRARAAATRDPLPRSLALDDRSVLIARDSSDHDAAEKSRRLDRDKCASMFVRTERSGQATRPHLICPSRGGTPDRGADTPAIRPVRAARLVPERRTLPRSPSLGVLGRPLPPSLPNRRLPAFAPVPRPRRRPGRAREPQLPDRPRHPHPSSRRLREPRQPGRKVRKRQ